MNLIIYKRFLLIIFLLLAPTIGQSTGQEPVLSGIVKSKTGELIAGVAVRSYCGETKTDDHGQYFILPSSSNARCGLVRFLAEGFLTIAVAIEDNVHELNVTLHPKGSKWIPPDWDPVASNRVGGKMKFLIPKGAKIKYGPPSDAWHIGIGYGPRNRREWMGINGGGNYSSGLPMISYMNNSAELVHREMGCGPNGYDIRGRTQDGKRWRTTGMGQSGFGESIGYDNASEKAAAFFDSIIDGLQCDQKGIPGFGSIPDKKR